MQFKFYLTKKNLLFLNIISLVFLYSFFVCNKFCLASNKDDLKKKQVLSFEDELVKGKTPTAGTFFMFEKKDEGQKSLIKLRENFLPEMRKTAEDL